MPFLPLNQQCQSTEGKISQMALQGADKKTPPTKICALEQIVFYV